MERGGLVVQVGTTLTMNLALPVGGIEENVTVTGQSPLVDTTSARVGGNIGTAELSELPAMNRNYFAAVALLPGVQFAPSNQMGNDTIIAGGQTSQNNSVTVDGGYNADDALGTSAGAQVRTPLEAIQEFQVLTSMYDAEYGRASGAIVNAVTKSGTNQFSGVAFLSAASNALTSKDFLVKQNNLAKPTATKRDWGGVLGGPIVQNKAHFFVSLERQVDNPTRTRVFPSRPSLDFSLAEQRSGWNTLYRFDHQINSSHTWAVRYLRESAPQFPIVGDVRTTRESVSDETDVDNMAVGTLTSVFGNAKVNTVRVARTWEHWWHGNECSRHGDERLEREGLQVNCAPQLAYPNFFAQASTEAQGPWDSNYLLEDNFSWFIPGKKGDHDVKFGARYNYTELQARLADQSERHVRVQYRSAVRRRQPEDLPRTAANPDGGVRGVHQQPHARAVRPGQVEDGRTHDIERRDSLRSRAHPAQRDGQPAVPRRRQELPGGQEQLLAAHRPHAFARRPGQVGHSRRLRAVLQPDDPGRDRRHD